MSEPGDRPIAPSKKLALYVAALVTVYIVQRPLAVLVLSAVFAVVAGVAILRARRPVPRNRWRAAIVFVAWVFLMRLALDAVSGVSLRDPDIWLVAGRQAARVAVLAIGVIALLAGTTARDVVDELEHSRLPRTARLLVMMVVQYPRVLRDRYEQIVEAQVARGAERPRTIVQRATHGAALLLPVMQSELNAVGERASLIHLRGLDMEANCRPERSERPAFSLRFDHYGFTYSSADRPSLVDVNLDLKPGQLVSVIAAQGQGKTTFLRAAAGLLGQIYEGEVKGSLTRPDSARPGAFFDGYVQVTLAVETVREEIGLPLYAAGLSRSDRDARVESVARELRIEHLLDRDVTALSGGEEKLVGIAAAFVPDSSVHVLDEPFEQLDVPHLAAVIRAAKIRARAGRLVLVGTGSVDTAVNICDAAIVFDGGAWRLIEKPAYSDLAGVSGLGGSSVEAFLKKRAADVRGVRRFRDGVRRVS